MDNSTGHTGLESEAESILDCEVEGNFPVSNILGNTELGSEAGNMPDFNGKEDWDFGTMLKSEAGNMETMKRVKEKKNGKLFKTRKKRRVVRKKIF